jgi:hypothetical protein
MLNIGMHKLQSAMEYLMTYGWAILIIGVVLVALYELNVFTPSNYVSPICTLPAGFTCVSDYFYGNGLIALNIEYTNINPINITQIGCNSNQTTANIHKYSPPVPMNSGENSTFMVTCYQGSTPFSGQLSSLFTGSIALNYTDTRTGFQNFIYGKIVAKVTSS